jgi:hypothetical protein
VTVLDSPSRRLVEASRRRTPRMRRPHSLTRAEDTISGEGAPQLFGAVPDDSEEHQRSFMRASRPPVQFPQTPRRVGSGRVSLDLGQRDHTAAPRMEPTFRGVAALLARARLRRYMTEQDRAEDDALPLDTDRARWHQSGNRPATHE